MDRTCLALIQLYDRMRKELEDEIGSLGGNVKCFSPETFNVEIVIDPKLQTYAEECVAELIIRYNNKRKKIMADDIFIGLKLLMYTVDKPEG